MLRLLYNYCMYNYVVSACAFETDHLPAFLWINTLTFTYQPPGFFQRMNMLPFRPSRIAYVGRGFTLIFLHRPNIELALNLFQLFQFSTIKKTGILWPFTMHANEKKKKEYFLSKPPHKSWYFFLSNAWCDIAKNSIHPPQHHRFSRKSNDLGDNYSWILTQARPVVFTVLERLCRWW